MIQEKYFFWAWNKKERTDKQHMGSLLHRCAGAIEELCSLFPWSLQVLEISLREKITIIPGIRKKKQTNKHPQPSPAVHEV
jgi:hypothetical protein